ncbi:60S ribosomal protein L22, partial [Blyttiomyces sp. JEL0837]
KTTKSTKKALPVKYTIDCSAPAGDDIFDTAAFEKFLHDRIKVDDRTNNLGTKITISRNASVITVTTIPNTIAKRYLKYLTKKYLKKNQIRDWLRVVAVSKTGYELRYPSINNDDEEEEEDDE